MEYYLTFQFIFTLTVFVVTNSNFNSVTGEYSPYDGGSELLCNGNINYNS